MGTLAHMLDLGWIIYTSKHSCVYSLIRQGKKEKKEPGPALSHSVFAVSVWPNWVLPLEETAFTQFSFLFAHPHSFFQKWLFPRICVQLLAGSCTWGKGNHLLFSKGNEDVAVFLLRNGAFFCSYILMDSPESSKHLLRKYFIETTPLPGSAPAKTVSNHLSAWRDVVLKGPHVNNW